MFSFVIRGVSARPFITWSSSPLNFLFSVLRRSELLCASLFLFIVEFPLSVVRIGQLLGDQNASRPASGYIREIFPAARFPSKNVRRSGRRIHQPRYRSVPEEVFVPL